MSDSSVIARLLLTSFVHSPPKVTEWNENVIGERDANDQHVFEVENNFSHISPTTLCDDVSGEVRPSVVNGGEKTTKKKTFMITASKKRRDVMKMLKQRPSLDLDSKNVLAQNNSIHDFQSSSATASLIHHKQHALSLTDICVKWKCCKLYAKIDRSIGYQ